MKKPERVRLSRKAGWKKPAGTVVVSRPSKWGNPFRFEAFQERDPGLSDRDARKLAVAAFERALRRGALPFSVADVRRELRGLSLGCWCPLPEPGERDVCHAAVLIAIANGR